MQETSLINGVEIDTSKENPYKLEKENVNRFIDYILSQKQRYIIWFTYKCDTCGETFIKRADRHKRYCNVNFLCKCGHCLKKDGSQSIFNKKPKPKEIRTQKAKLSFIESANQIHNNIYDYSLVNYVNARTKVKIICKVHGIFEQTPDSHARGCGCPKCFGTTRKTNDSFIKEAQLIHQCRYDYSKVNYISAHRYVEIICKDHGSFFQSPANHLAGKGCPKCGAILTAIKETTTREDFIEKARIIQMEKGYCFDYTKVDYINCKLPVEIVCHQHGSFFQTPDIHLSGSSCPKCSIKYMHTGIKKSLEDFINDARNIHGDTYDYSQVDYKGSFHKVNIICRRHGSFFQTPSAHLNGCGCPKCNMPKGEIKIYQFLNKNNIKYESQKTFDDLKNVNKLSYDFYIPNKKLLIEYNGQQHYEPVKIFGGEKKFKIQQKRDKIKREYAIHNNYRLLIIPYWDFVNIEDILKEEILNGKTERR